MYLYCFFAAAVGRRQLKLTIYRIVFFCLIICVCVLTLHRSNKQYDVVVTLPLFNHCIDFFVATIFGRSRCTLLYILHGVFYLNVRQQLVFINP